MAAEGRGIDIDAAVTGNSITLGWQSGCKCPYPGPPVPCVVLDPFAGRGTTPSVAIRLHRNAIACDLKDEYAELIRKNCYNEAPLWVHEENAVSESKPAG